MQPPRQNQAYSYAQQQQPHQYVTRSGRTVNPPPQLTQNVPLSQLDSQAMGSQQHLFRPDQAQNPPQQHVFRPDPSQNAPQFLAQQQPLHQSQYQPQQLQYPVQRQQPLPQQHQQRQPQQGGQQQQQQGGQQQPQQGGQQFRSTANPRMDTSDRRVAPRLGGFPPGHAQWAGETGFDQNVLTASYRAPYGQPALQYPEYVTEGFHQPPQPFAANQPQPQFQVQQFQPQQQYPEPQWEHQQLPPQLVLEQHQQQFSPPAPRRRLEDDPQYTGEHVADTQLESQLQQMQGQLESQRQQIQDLLNQQRPVPFQQQQLDSQPYRRDFGYGDDGFQEEAGGKVTRRKVPPFPESMGSALASHTTDEEYDAYNMVKNYLFRSAVSPIWCDGSEWGVSREVIIQFVLFPATNTHGRATISRIVQKLEEVCESALRVLQAACKVLDPEQGFRALPPGLFNQCGPLLHYMASCVKIRDSSPGAHKLGYLFALHEARPTEWESMKAGWLVAAQYKSPLGREDKFLQYDGTEASVEEPPTGGRGGGGGGGGGGGRGGGGGGGSGRGGGGRGGGGGGGVQSSGGGSPSGGPPRKTAPAHDSPAQKHPKDQNKHPKESLSPAKLARIAGHAGNVPPNAKDNHKCLNCGGDHYGDKCELECIRCEDNHLPRACPKSRQNKGMTSY